MPANSREQELENALRNLLAGIDQNTDCMSNLIDRLRLDPLIDQAFVVLADGWEPEPIVFFPSTAA